MSASTSFPSSDPSTVADELNTLESDMWLDTALDASLKALPVGYLNVLVSDGGQLRVRGTREWTERFLATLVEHGWQIDCDGLQWCG